MKTNTASKRNPLFPMIFFMLCGLFMMATGSRELMRSAATATGLPLEQLTTDPTGPRGPAAAAAEPQDVAAPEAHLYGFELLKRGLWKEAETVLRDSCETGDLTACHVVADEYAIREDFEKAETGYWLSCRGGQMNSCRKLVDEHQFTTEKRILAIEQLTEECRDNEDAAACTLLAESKWAKSDLKRARQFLGLACSRGDERSCSRLNKGS